MADTREKLQEKTVAELRHMCVYDLEIPGMTKKTKDVIIDAIVRVEEAKSNAIAIATGKVPAPTGTSSVVQKQKNIPQNDVTSAEMFISSRITKPNAKYGDKTTSTIKVSCGASSGSFDVAGKTVGAVSEFLREVINVDRMANGIVNGKEAKDEYVLQEGDSLEFIKPAGQKG